MGRVADAQESVAIPAPQPVDTNRQQLDVVPRRDFADAVGEKRRERRDSRAKRIEASCADTFVTALADDQRALVILVPIDRNENSTLTDDAQARRRIVRPARKTQPEHVNRRAKV